MPEYLSPGVYVEEVDRGPKPIEGVGTAMALQLALLFLGDEGIYPEGDPEDPTALRLGSSVFRPLSQGFGGYARIDVGGFQYPLDFRGVPPSLPTVGFGALLAGDFEPEAFRDRIVVLGVSAESLTDRLRIPLDAEAGAGRGDHRGVVDAGGSVDAIALEVDDGVQRHGLNPATGPASRPAVASRARCRPRGAGPRASHLRRGRTGRPRRRTRPGPRRSA